MVQVKTILILDHTKLCSVHNSVVRRCVLVDDSLSYTRGGGPGDAWLQTFRAPPASATPLSTYLPNDGNVFTLRHVKPSKLGIGWTRRRKCALKHIKDHLNKENVEAVASLAE